MLVGFRGGDRDEFDLGKLVLPYHAPRIASGGAGFGAETRRQRGQAHRQFFFVDDGFANEICQRHFGGGDEAEAFMSQYIEEKLYMGNCISELLWSLFFGVRQITK